ncbi:MAG: FxsA family protein [Mycobacterium sp.]|nr:FxsA family protein [Mycobacterium sp.]
MVTRQSLRSPARFVGLYALVELAALALLIWAVGLGWTLVVVAATFMAGVLLVASQVRGQLAAARRAGADPRAAVTDGVLVALGSFLVFLPGLVSTAAGVLMLAPPTRGGMRPLATAMLTRGVSRRLEGLSWTAGTLWTAGPNPGPYSNGPYGYRDYPNTPHPNTGAGRGDYIDGEVIGEVIEELPSRR